MKKIFYSVLAIAALSMATACTEDRGTTTEVANANENESVDPNDIRAYERPGTAGKGSNAATLQEPVSAVELVTTYYTEPDRPGGFTEELSYSETASMGGQTTQQSDTTKTGVSKMSFGGGRSANPTKPNVSSKQTGGLVTKPKDANQKNEVKQKTELQKQQDLKKKN